MFQKLYQSPLLTESARSFVLNHVGAIINTYVVTSMETWTFHAHDKCKEAHALGVNLEHMCDRLCDRMDEEMRRWGVLYYSDVLGLYMQKAGWIGLCIAFQQKGQAAALFQKLYQSPLLTESARSFVLNHVGAIINTYVVTSMETWTFHAHDKCKEAHALGVNLEHMGDWDAFEEDMDANDGDREVVVPAERRKRSPDARRFGGIPIRASSRGYSRRASIRAQRPRPNTRPKTGNGVKNGNGAKPNGKPNTKPKQNPPHVKTVPTKDGKTVDVNNNQAYVSSKIPEGAIAIKQPGGAVVGKNEPAPPPSTGAKVQPSSQAWGDTKLPGSSNTKTGSLPGSNNRKRPVDTNDPTSPAKKPKVDNPVKETQPSSTKQSSTAKRPSVKANLLRHKSQTAKPINGQRLRNYLCSSEHLARKRLVYAAYKIRFAKNQISQHKYLRALDVQRRASRKLKAQNNPLQTPKTKLSNRDAVADMPKNPQHMESSVKTLTNWFDRHPRVDAFVAGLGNMASSTIAFSISGIAAVAYDRKVWGPKEQAVKKVVEESNKDQPYSLLTDPTTNVTYAVKPDQVPDDAVSRKKFEEDQRFQQEILARAAIPVNPEAEKRIVDVLRLQDKVNKLWQVANRQVKPTPSFAGNEDNPTLEQAIEAANYNPHALKIKNDPMGYQEELEADSTDFLVDNVDKYSETQKSNIGLGDDLGRQIYDMIKSYREKHLKAPPPSDREDLALLAGGGDSLWG